MVQLIKNLVFEGGGIKGIAYVGALEELESQGISLSKIKNVAGTSIGALTALLLGLNYHVSEIKTLLYSLDFPSVKDDSWGMVRDFFRLIKNYGIYRGAKVRNLIDQVIENKTRNKKITFAEIEALKEKYGFKNMYFIVTNLSTGNCEIFSYEHTPNLMVADAIYSSLAIPLLFPPIRINRNRHGELNEESGDFYIDGGIINNYPIRIFDSKKYFSNDALINEVNNQESNQFLENRHNKQRIYNFETLGLRLEDKDKINEFSTHDITLNKKSISNFKDYVFTLLDTILTAQQDFNYIESKDYLRTIYIDTLEVKSNDFSLSVEKKLKLIDSGKDGVRQFFLNPYYEKKSKLNVFIKQNIFLKNLLSLLYPLIAYIVMFLAYIDGEVLYHRDLSLILKEIVTILEAIK